MFLNFVYHFYGNSIFIKNYFSFKNQKKKHLFLKMKWVKALTSR